jgi:CBS domain containing-hemolysin-like protein
MVPRTEIVALPAESTIDEAVTLALRHRHTRVPVYEETIDNVVGVLSTRDLLGVLARRGANGAASVRTTVRRLMRQPLVVPQGATVAEVLAAMKANRQPMAVVLDEYGGTAGIVTLSDLVTRLLGSVGDEYAAATHEIRTLGDGTVDADGLALVDDVNAELNTHFDTSEVDTIGGLVFSELGRRPRVGDEVDIGNQWRARVDRLDGLRIARVRLLPPHPAAVGSAVTGAPEEDGAA